MAKRKSVDSYMGIDKETLFVEPNKMKSISKDMDKQLGIISKSLEEMHSIVEYLLQKNVLKGNKEETFRSFSKKAASQANAANKLKESLSGTIENDYKEYQIEDIDQRISEIEKKLSSVDKG